MQIPVATYRIQFQPAFGFGDAAKVVPYLAELGISHLYASPVFKARKGSPHGYDVVDSNKINPELGTRADLEALIDQLKVRDMGYIQDMVPNHMAFDYDNKMLTHVLENGEHSRYFDYFDINWHHPYESIRGRVLAPFLGKFFGEALESAEIRLHYNEHGFTIRYFDLVFPVKIESYGRLLATGLDRLKETLGGDHPDFIKMLGILYLLKALPENKDRDDQVRFIKGALWEMYINNGVVTRFMTDNVDRFNGVVGDPASWAGLEDLLAEQIYRLSFWKTATEEINYRRFFNVNDLICVRVEKQVVFQGTHLLLFDLVDQGMIQGLRIDHVDGLYDPAGYIGRLRDRVGDRYILLEKILDPDEDLPESWPVQGTTGYDSLNMLNGIFCDRRNKRDFTRIYHKFMGVRMDYPMIRYKNKRLILQKEMAGDVDNLALLLKGVSGRNRHAADITLQGLKETLVEIMSEFPVYRTYLGEGPLRSADAGFVRTAVSEARRRNPKLHYELDFIERFLLLQYDAYLTEEERAQWVHFCKRFQQYTGPLMAKGFEDTVLYVYNRLLSLNEVGGDPESFGVTLDDFHAFHEKRRTRWAHSMNATATHDCKRGEDVRARIHVLSEIPEEWESHLKVWNKVNQKKKKRSAGNMVPDRNDEYFLYQTLIGAWPFHGQDHSRFVQRIKAYIVKAVREAKVHTAWLKPDSHYEEAYLSFIDRILNPQESSDFWQDFLPFQRRIAFWGMFNSLSQTLVKITLPGVPDFYQGTELWDLNLVDPDNRRPVDFLSRQEVLWDVRQRMDNPLPGFLQDLLHHKEDGRIKLFLIHKALTARSRRAELFQEGGYKALKTRGRFRDHIVAFARRLGQECALTIVPRFLTRLVQEGEDPLGKRIWQDTEVILPREWPDTWHNLLTGRMVQGNGHLFVGEVFEDFPVALLVSSNPSPML